MLTKDQRIEMQVPSRYLSNYGDIDLHHLRGIAEYNDALLNSKGPYFEAYVQEGYYTGETLLYYPELTPQIRTLVDYPRLSRQYDTPTSLSGMPFISHLFDSILSCYHLFERERAKLSQYITHLVNQYGCKRYEPIIESVKAYDTGIIYAMAIHDVIWHIDTTRYKQSNYRDIEQINLYELLGISYIDYESLAMVDATIGTPFIAVKLAKTWKHKGHTVWYSLDTRQPVTKQEMQNWPQP